MLCLIEQDENGEVIDFCLAHDEYALRRALLRRGKRQDIARWLYVKEHIAPGIHRLRDGLTLLVS
jgi:hypothetical protein